VTATTRDDHKRLAASHAASLVEDGMLLGLGSGTTAEQFVRAVGERVAMGLNVSGVASSERTARVAREVGLPLIAFTGPLDLAVDGADAIERGSLSAIKGLGGALTREKLIACSAQRFVLVGDDGKVVGCLAEVLPAIPVPVEVLAFGWQVTRSRLSALGEPVARVRGSALFETDNGNYILDLYQPDLSDPERLGALLAGLPGVVEHGLFLGMAVAAIVAGGSGIDVMSVASS